MDIDNHIPIANYIFVTITAGVLAYVTAMSEDVDKSYEMPPEYADKDEDEETQDKPDTPIDTSDNTESADDNNGYVSSFGAGISGFFAGLGATNKENTQEKDKEQSPIGDDKDYDSLQESPEEKEDSEGQGDKAEKEEKEETPERDNNNDERLQETQENKEDGVENSPSKELQGIEEPDSIEKIDRVSIKNEDSLDVIEKKPVTGGTKHNKSSKKAKSNMKRKTSSNKKRKTNGQK